MKRIIRKVAVLGSGSMGSQIACHFANAGMEVLLLDIIPNQLTEAEEKKGISTNDNVFRNRIVNENLKKALDARPGPLYLKSNAERISKGNFEDDLQKLSEFDWILEAIVEKVSIKKELFAKVDNIRKKGSLITTNTSGISVNKLCEGRSEDFRKHFCGTHFFNPPRYLPLLELIPSEHTDDECIRFLSRFGEKILGKTTITCNDTPAFIANRIGIYGMMLTMDLMQKSGMSIEEIDALTGRPAGRPKSATFRTCDLVGLDVLKHVADDLLQHAGEKEEKDLFQLPEFFQKMIENGWTGNKSGQGFYKKVKDENGISVIYALDPKTLAYQPLKKPRFLIIEELKKKFLPEDKIKTIRDGNTEGVGFLKKFLLGTFGNDNAKAIGFYHHFFYRLFAYCSRRLPEITSDLYKVDDAMKKGFGWNLGPFETWDIFGVKETLGKMEQEVLDVAEWTKEMVASGCASFYKVEDGIRYYYDLNSKSYQQVPGSRIYPSNALLRGEKTIWNNKGANLIDLGDGVLNVEFTTKGHTLDLDIMDALDKAMEYGKSDFNAITIANEGDDFSFGANLEFIGWSAWKGKFRDIEHAIDRFQQVITGLRYCDVPVVAAPYGRTLGGAAELCMHADVVMAAAETYMGLVELGVGLIPAGAGTKEFTARAAELYSEEDPKIQHLQERLSTIAQAKVSTSAHEAFELGYLRRGRDEIVMNKDHLLKEAKQKALQLHDKGYVPPRPARIPVLGRTALGFFYMGINNLKNGNFITGYEEQMVRRLAWVMCGGDLTGEQEVDESYLLQLEKEVFMELIRNKKTLHRIQHIGKTGKPLRN